jgi:hypothetical protein
MTVLLIDDNAKAAAKRVLDWASKPENLYVDGPGGKSGQPPPGDDWRHTVRLSGHYRCVFSYTKADGRIWRHLSVSVPSDKWAHPVAAFMIASDLFGFTGWDGVSWDTMPADWLPHIDHEDHCIVLAQEVRTAQQGVA